MGAFLDKPMTDKKSDGGVGGDFRYGLSSMQGWRVEMEDAHCAVVGLPGGLDDWSFFAVFDGHAGAKVSGFCSDNLLDAITKREELKEQKSKEIVADNIITAIKHGFLALDDQMREIPEIKSGEDRSGTTAVCIMMAPDRIFFANCGDSRSILCSNGEVSYATQDHKPINPQERERIQNAGGSVMIQRVNGSLAVSRALGDFEYKNVQGKGPCEQLVSPEPEIVEVLRKKDKDEFLILACDGIYDVMTNDELADFVRGRMLLTDDLKSICNQVVDTCLYKGSRDNMSIVIIAFEGAPKVSEEAKKKEAEVDAKLEAKVKELVGEDPRQEKTPLHFVLQNLSGAEIEGLPPGGGLSAKKPLIEDIYYKLCPPKPQDD